jgi:hypothetical protein
MEPCSGRIDLAIGQWLAFMCIAPASADVQGDGQEVVQGPIVDAKAIK